MHGTEETPEFIDLLDRLILSHQEDLARALESFLHKHWTHRGVAIYQYTDRLGYWVSCKQCGIDKQKVISTPSGGVAGSIDHDAS